jgi:hypothetical protein
MTLTLHLGLDHMTPFLHDALMCSFDGLCFLPGLIFHNYDN